MIRSRPADERDGAKPVSTSFAGYNTDGVFQTLTAWHLGANNPRQAPSYPPSSRFVGSIVDEAQRTAKSIFTTSSTPIQILMTREMASDAALRSFVSSGIPVEAILIRFKYDFNLLNYAWQVQLCEELDVPYRTLELDVLKFFGFQAEIYFNLTYCTDPRTLIEMWMCEQIGNRPVIPSMPEHLLQKGVSGVDGNWSIVESNDFLSLFWFFAKREINGVPSFYWYSTECMLAYLQNRTIRDLCANKFPGKLSDNSSRHLIFREFGTVDGSKYSGRKTNHVSVLSEELALERYLRGKRQRHPWEKSCDYNEMLQMLAPVTRIPANMGNVVPNGPR